MPLTSPGKFVTAPIDNSYGGDGAGGNNQGDFCTFVGAGSGVNNTRDLCTFMGVGVGLDNVGENNTYLGSHIAFQNSHGNRNTVVGSESFTNFQLDGVFSPDDITVVGAFNMAGLGSPTPSSNIVSIGSNIGAPITAAQIINNCVFIGQGMAAAAGVTYDGAVIIGIGADGSSQDVVIGANAFNTITTSQGENVIIGTEAAQFCQNLDSNVFVGYRAGWQSFATPSTNNVAVGWQAGQNMFGANNNVYIGRNAGMGNGDDNIMIGPSLGGNGSGNVFIGEGLVYNISDAFVLEGQSSPASRPLITGDFIAVNFGFNVAVGSAPYGNGSGVFAMGNRTIAPNASNPTGGILYVQAGALRYRGSAGTDVEIAAA